MKKIKFKLDTHRREFIRLSTLAGVGIAASTVLPGAAIANVGDDKSTAKQHQGYQLTRHVIEYYKSAAS